jgi:hypothetical protein
MDNCSAFKCYRMAEVVICLAADRKKEGRIGLVGLNKGILQTRYP